MAEAGTPFDRGGEDHAYEVVTDSEGNVYVVGYVEGTLPGQTHHGRGDAFIHKYNPAGGLLWTRQFGTEWGDFAHG